MKKTILIYLSFGFLIFSCVNPNSNKQNLKAVEKSYQQIVNEELASGKINDTIFLDFTFGMNEKMVERKFDNLII